MDEASQRPSYGALVSNQGVIASAMTDSQFNFKDGSRRQAACNEPVKDYAPGSTERTQIKAQLAQMLTERIELPLVIGGEHVRTGLLEPAIVPHDHAHVLADAHLAGRKHIEDAIVAAQRAWPAWSRTPWRERAAIFLRAADLLSGHGVTCSRRYHARSVQDSLSSGNRLGGGINRLLALQRRFHAAPV